MVPALNLRALHSERAQREALSERPKASLFDKISSIATKAFIAIQAAAEKAYAVANDFYAKYPKQACAISILATGIFLSIVGFPQALGVAIALNAIVLSMPRE